MTSLLLVRKFTADYARNGVNLLVLVLVPVVFVVVAAPSLADTARLLGGTGTPVATETVTAGWTAGFLAAVAMYFQVAGARGADARLVLSGLPTARLAIGRMLTGFLLALVASAAALLALLARTGIHDPVRVIAGTVMFAVIYLAIGAVVGAGVPSPVNGTVLILFIWILDVFFGPAMSAADRVATRWMPTHFVSLWMVDLPSRHGGRIGDPGWALMWTLGAVGVAFAVVSAAVGVRRHSRGRRSPGSASDQLAAALRGGWRDVRRNPVLWVLLAAVPTVFIVLAQATTPHGSTPIVLTEGGRQFTALFDPARIHGATMAPIAVASLATLAGLFLVLDARSGDHRLVLAGLRVRVVLAARLTLVALAALVAAGVSLAVTATVFNARQWAVYAAGLLLVAVTYGMIGVLLGPILGRVGGVFIAFLAPFLDLGIGQSPMLRGLPPTWAQYLPGYGGIRVLLDGALTTDFDQTRALLIALAWLAALTLTAGWLLHRGVRSTVATEPPTARPADRPAQLTPA